MPKKYYNSTYRNDKKNTILFFTIVVYIRRDVVVHLTFLEIHSLLHHRRCRRQGLLPRLRRRSNWV